MPVRKTWNDQEILDALKYWAERYGRTPKWADWEHKDEEGLRPTNMTVWSRVGSWTDALIMAGLEPNVPPKSQQRRFSRPEARRLRKEGLSDIRIGELLGVHGSTIGKALGPRELPPPQQRRKPRNAQEAREWRIEALQKALEKERKESFEERLKKLRKKKAAASRA